MYEHIDLNTESDILARPARAAGARLRDGPEGDRRDRVRRARRARAARRVPVVEVLQRRGGGAGRRTTPCGRGGCFATRVGSTQDGDGILEKNGKDLVLTISTTAGRLNRERTEIVLRDQYREVGVDLKVRNYNPTVFAGSYEENGILKTRQVRPRDVRVAVVSRAGDQGGPLLDTHDSSRGTEPPEDPQRAAHRAARAGRARNRRDAPRRRSTTRSRRSSSTKSPVIPLFWYTAVDACTRRLMNYKTEPHPVIGHLERQHVVPRARNAVIPPQLEAPHDAPPRPADLGHTALRGWCEPAPTSRLGRAPPRIARRRGRYGTNLASFANGKPDRDGKIVTVYTTSCCINDRIHRSKTRRDRPGSPAGLRGLFRAAARDSRRAGVGVCREPAGAAGRCRADPVELRVWTARSPSSTRFGSNESSSTATLACRTRRASPSSEMIAERLPATLELDGIGVRDRARDRSCHRRHLGAQAPHTGRVASHGGFSRRRFDTSLLAGHRVGDALQRSLEDLRARRERDARRAILDRRSPPAPRAPRCGARSFLRGHVGPLSARDARGSARRGLHHRRPREGPSRIRRRPAARSSKRARPGRHRRHDEHPRLVHRVGRRRIDLRVARVWDGFSTRGS